MNYLLEEISEIKKARVRLRNTGRALKKGAALAGKVYNDPKGSLKKGSKIAGNVIKNVVKNPSSILTGANTLYDKGVVQLKNGRRTLRKLDKTTKDVVKAGARQAGSVAKTADSSAGYIKNKIYTAKKNVRRTVNDIKNTPNNIKKVLQDEYEKGKRE